MVTRRLFVEWLILLAAGVALGFLAARIDLANRFDASLLDRAAALARPAASSDIVIVAIDDASLAQTGAWPWPRTIHAQLLDRLAEAVSGPVMFDVLFLEPSTQANDAAFAQAISRHGQVVLPMTFAARPNAVSGIVPIFPIDPFLQSAAAIGHVAITPDDDGVLRRVDLVMEADGRSFPQFVQAARSLGQIAIADRGADPVVSFHPEGTYSQVSAEAVINGNVPEEFLRGKTVLVGATAQGMGDRYSVGAGGVDVLSGVEIQANLFDALRGGVLVRDLPPFWSGLLAAFALLAQFLVFWKMSPRAGLCATLAIAGLALTGTFALVSLAGLWVAPGVAILIVIFAYPLWGWRRLTSVSAYLEEEAAFLRPEGARRAKVEGFDRIARQVARMRGLVSHVSEGFAFLDKVIEAAPDPILVLDRQGLIIMTNAKGQELFPDWDRNNPALLVTLLEQCDAGLDPERSEIGFKGGRIFLVARAALEMGDSIQSGEIIMLRDVSATRRREEERREMLEFLSHDMRTPQVAIIGLAGRLGKDAQAEDIADRIRTQATRTLKLSDDFVQLARMDESDPELEDCDLVAAVEEADDRAYSAARARGIAIISDLPGDPLYADADPSLIARLLDNLIGNAIKFSPQGSTVSIALQQALRGKVELIVSDEGPGLPPERRDNPFGRFGAHEGKAGPSVGLGLALVKRVVEKHGGAIRVETGDDTGTRFSIELPQSR